MSLKASGTWESNSVEWGIVMRSPKRWSYLTSRLLFVEECEVCVHGSTLQREPIREKTRYS